MVYCVAYGCTTKSGCGKSLFHFPKNPALSKTWIKQIRRKDWKPSSHSRLCSDHFEDASFTTNPNLAASCGFKLKSLHLKAGAIPTRFVFNAPSSSRQSTAINKRQNLKLLESVKNQDDVEMMATTSDNCMDVDSTALNDRDLDTDLGEELIFDQNDDVYPQQKFIDCGVQASSEVASKEINCHLPPVPTKNAKVQTKKMTKDKAVEARLTTIQVPTKKDAATMCTLLKPVGKDEEIALDDTINEEDRECEDDWNPLTSDSDEDCDDDDESKSIMSELSTETPPLKQRKFVVYESCLHILFSVCSICFLETKAFIQKISGTCVEICQVCPHHHTKIWCSQPKMGILPHGNLAVASGILFSGATPMKVLNMFKHLNISSISYRTFNLIQKCYLIPSILRVWNHHQETILSNLRKSHVMLAGDARCDSPGYSAKYGSYTLLDVESSKVVEMQLVQCNEVSSSNAMELAGLIRGMFTLHAHGIKIHSLTTDRHQSVKKFMHQECSHILHYFDVWHVAKGVTKKLEKKGKLKSCLDLLQWSHSISNHIYWCAASSDGDGQLVREKWLSILNHIVDVHEGHGEKYSVCEHPVLENRFWLKKGSKPHKELELILKQSGLLKDIEKLSPHGQTSSLESFHKIVCYFAPKFNHYFYKSMQARITLAILHFNENSKREQAKTEVGDIRWKISYPKHKKGKGILKKVKTDITFDYVAELLQEVEELRIRYPTYEKASEIITQIVPPNITDSLDKEEKNTVIELHQTRF